MTKKKETKQSERGITPRKVAYLYGVSLETFNTWIGNADDLNARMELEDKYLDHYRKWTPNQLWMIFNEFGDPREFQDIIDS